MVEHLIKSFYPEATVSILDSNFAYNFSIKLAKGMGFQFVFTEGLSQHKQTVKEGFESFENIELYFCLPDFWDLETNYWPIEWINTLAEIPQKNNTWFGPGDTIPAGNPPEILTDRFPANHFMLVNPIELDDLLGHKIWKENNIQFLGILPICQLELDFKIRNSWTVLSKKLEKKGVTEMVDQFRTSVCRNRILGLF